MELPPPVNPDVNAIADQAKFSYAVAKELLSAVQYRLGQLAGTGGLDPEESIRLQEVLFGVFDVLYVGTVGAIRDEEADDVAEGDNTYSDGRRVRTSIWIEPIEESVKSWKYDEFMLAYSCFMQRPRGQVTCIAPVLGRTITYGCGALDVERGGDDADVLRESHDREYEYMLDNASQLEEFGISDRPLGLER